MWSASLLHRSSGFWIYWWKKILTFWIFRASDVYLADLSYSWTVVPALLFARLYIYPHQQIPLLGLEVTHNVRVYVPVQFTQFRPQLIKSDTTQGSNTYGQLSPKPHERIARQ
jgi:hypothetical protein